MRLASLFLLVSKLGMDFHFHICFLLGFIRLVLFRLIVCEAWKTLPPDEKKRQHILRQVDTVRKEHLQSQSQPSVFTTMTGQSSAPKPGRRLPDKHRTSKRRNMVPDQDSQRQADWRAGLWCPAVSRGRRVSRGWHAPCVNARAETISEILSTCYPPLSH